VLVVKGNAISSQFIPFEEYFRLGMFPVFRPVAIHPSDTNPEVAFEYPPHTTFAPDILNPFDAVVQTAPTPSVEY
jgi:hypothetical protein